jgi:hypothetical protein
MIRFLCALGFSGLCALIADAQSTGAPLNEAQKQFLTDYEAIRAALAADDLSAARKAAVPVAERDSKSTEKKTQTRAESAGKLAKAASLEAAREAFKSLSKSAVHLAEGKEGYYVAHCPMVPNEEGDWVQTTKRINNPYMGKAMLTCGSIEK